MRVDEYATVEPRRGFNAFQSEAVVAKAGYEAAACDMIQRTSTEMAPWTLVEADDKNWARVKVLRTVAKLLEAAL